MELKCGLFVFNLLHTIMAASPLPADRGDMDKWANLDDQGGESMGPVGDASASNGGPGPEDRDRAGNENANPEYSRSAGGTDATPGGKHGASVYREKQIKVLRSSLVLCLALSHAGA